MARKPLMAANWKMNNTIPEAVVLAQEISNRYDKEWKEYVDIVVIPPYTDIKPVKTVFDFDRRAVSVGAQNVFFEEDGAYTGEISARMLEEIGVSYCIVGHSERRSLFEETNEDVNKKVKALLNHDISPIICVGESLLKREKDDFLGYIALQVQAALAGLQDSDIAKCTIAYEPIWAIGTGRTATPHQAEEVCAMIRNVLAHLTSQNIADEIRILYGGSMNVGNVKLLLEQPNIDGGLVGGAGLKADSFVQLIQACV